MKQSEPTIQQSTVDRWLAILKAIALHPGLKPEELKQKLDVSLGRRSGMSTLYKDLALLKEAGLLDPGRHRQGYFLAGTNHSHEENQVLLNGLRIQAEDLGNPMARELYERLIQRAATTRVEKAFFSLPVEAVANRPVVPTHREEFADVMSYLREPLLRGQRVRLRLVRNAWQPKKGVQSWRVYPLQFVFHDIAWYLIAEDAETGTFMALRIDRLHSAVQIDEGSERGSVLQQERLELARALLRQGWGMAMPPHDRRGMVTAALVEARVRFSPSAAPFIEENLNRHESQTLERLSDGAMIFGVKLPESRSVFFHFKNWILSWGRSAEVLEPAWLREELAAEVAEMAGVYRLEAGERVAGPA